MRNYKNLILVLVALLLLLPTKSLSNAQVRKLSPMEEIRLVARQVGVPASLMQAVCWVESKHIDVHSPHDGGSPSYGMCQVKLGTAKGVARHFGFHKSDLKRMLKTRSGNLYIAAHVLKYHSEHKGCAELTGETLTNCVSYAYNTGRYPANVKETRTPYSQKVSRIARNLKLMENKNVCLAQNLEWI